MGHHPGTGSTFTRGSCVFSNDTKVPGCRTFGIAAPITCAALDTHPSTPPFGVVPRTRKLDCSGMETVSSLATNPDSISAVMTIVFVCGDPEDVKIPLDLTLRTRMILSQRRTSSHFNE
ncbi:uncharacterized protein TNCV_804541 [Trichonephila clavipes]|nr:uncharacterized protein TNCV_804541 [Trichonephila clavipes]